MPEGDTIHHTASALRTALVGHSLVAFEAPYLFGLKPALGGVIEEVESFGKATGATIDVPITSEDFGAVMIRMGERARGAFTASQVGGLTARQLNAMTAGVLGAFSTVQIAGLREAQVTALTASRHQITIVKPRNVEARPASWKARKFSVRSRRPSTFVCSAASGWILSPFKKKAVR